MTRKEENAEVVQISNETDLLKIGWRNEEVLEGENVENEQEDGATEDEDDYTNRKTQRNAPANSTFPKMMSARELTAMTTGQTRKIAAIVKNTHKRKK